MSSQSRDETQENPIIRLIAALFVLAGTSACAFTPRVVVLRNYAQVVPAGAVPKLAGMRVFVAPTVDARNDGMSWDAVKEDLRPPGFAPADPDRSANDRWAKELSDGLAHSDRPRYSLGDVRNLYGMKTSSVSSINSPIEWIDQSLRSEIAGQGASLAGGDSYDVMVQMTLRSMHADIYMSTKCRLVAEVSVSGRGADRKRVFCSSGSCLAWTGSSWEYYLAIHLAGQELIWNTLRWIVGEEPPMTDPMDEWRSYDSGESKAAE